MLFKINNGVSSKILVLAFIQLFLITISRFIIGPLIPILAIGLNTRLDVMGGILSLNVFVLLIATFSAGNLIELFGLKRIFYFAMVIQALGFAGFLFAKSILLFIIFYGLLGIGGGILTVCLILIANFLLSNRKDTRFFNLFLGASLALVTAPFVPIIINYFGINWRYPFLFFGLLQLCLLIGFLFLQLPEIKYTHMNLRELINANRTFFKSPILLLCFLFNFFNASVMDTFYAWFTSYFEIYNFGINISSFVLIIFAIAVFTGVFIKKYLIKYISLEKLLFYNVLSSIIFLTLNLFINNLAMKVLVIFFFGLSISANYIIIISLGLKDLKEKHSMVSGYLQGAEYVGIIIFQYISGILSEHIIKSGIIYMNIVLLVFLFIIVVSLNRYKKLYR